MDACKEISGGFLGALCLGMALAGAAIIGAGVGMTVSG
ncbi:putative membrane protein [Escherichia coli 6-319-05_S4_C3]|nr:putative membrane protein [Escherichia coli 6-319-05_S4_C3]